MVNSMWKCVMCETNNPDELKNCFICGTEKTYSQRMAEREKAAPVGVEESISAPDDIFGKAVYGGESRTEMRGHDTPVNPGIDKYMHEESFEIHDRLDKKLRKKLEKKALKERYRIEGKIYRSLGEKVFLGLLIAFCIFLILGTVLGILLSERDTSKAVYSETAQTELFAYSCNTIHETGNTFSKDVLICFA